MELHVNIIGVLLVSLALIHVIFPRYFNWRQELAALNLINRQLMYVHTFFVALVVLLMGIGCIAAAHDIVHTHLGHQLALGLAIFWGARLYCQFFVYSPLLWQGKPFETTVHAAFAVLWTYLTLVFAAIYAYSA